MHASIAAALLLAAVGAGEDAPLATLGWRVIRESDFRAYLASAEEAEAVAGDPAARREALEAYLDGLALVARGRQLGVDREPRFRKARELAEQKLLAHLVGERSRGRLEAAPPTVEELRAYHAAQAAELAVEPRFTARQLVVYVAGNPAFPERGRADPDARALAGAALARLVAGEGWDVVARAYSDEPGTRERGGTIRDAAFGHFAPEVERAVREQPLGVPGPVFRSAFGYHVVQVEARITQRSPRPFGEVRDLIAGRLAAERGAAARAAFLAAARAEVGLRLHEAALRDVSLLDPARVGPGELLATVAGEEVRESDFRWFLEDALLPRQRARAWARPGARRDHLAAFLDLRVLAAKARRDGLDRSETFRRRLALAEADLLREFTEAREGGAPPGQCAATGGGAARARRAHLDRVRAAVGLRPHGGGEAFGRP